MAVDKEQRLENERIHAQYLLTHGAPEVWGWGTPAGQKRVARRFDFFKTHAPLIPGKKVLEIGCGTGVFSTLLAQTGAITTAIDISPELIEQAKKTIPHKNISFEVQDAMATTFQDQSFDSVIGCSVLHHLDAPVALKEFYRLLKPGGTLVFSEPNMLNPQIALQKNIPYLKKLAGDSPDETAFFTWQIKKMLKKTGFKHFEVVPFDFLHPAVPKKLIPLVDALGKTIEKIPVINQIAGSLLIVAYK